MKSIDNLSLDKKIINKLKTININFIEELWQLKRIDLKNNNFSNDEINEIIISLQLIGLDLNKKEYTSEEFAKFLNDKLVEHGSNISFVIGGSYGLSDELKKRVNTSVTLSKLTFPHQLARVVLLEQIFRAFKIINNETYHK